VTNRAAIALAPRECEIEEHSSPQRDLIFNYPRKPIKPSLARPVNLRVSLRRFISSRRGSSRFYFRGVSSEQVVPFADSASMQPIVPLPPSTPPANRVTPG